MTVKRRTAGVDNRKNRPKIETNGIERFECEYPECKKSYTRAYHLYRHQLNHTPKQIYVCEVCDRKFVRQDLVIRHRERHTTQGSLLQKRDSFRRLSAINRDEPGSGTTQSGAASQSDGLAQPQIANFALSASMASRCVAVRDYKECKVPTTLPLHQMSSSDDVLCSTGINTIDGNWHTAQQNGFEGTIHNTDLPLHPPVHTYSGGSSSITRPCDSHPGLQTPVATSGLVDTTFYSHTIGAYPSFIPQNWTFDATSKFASDSCTSAYMLDKNFHPMFNDVDFASFSHVLPVSGFPPSSVFVNDCKLNLMVMYSGERIETDNG